MITVRQIKLIEKYIPTLHISEINTHNLMKEGNILFAIGFIPKDFMNRNTWIEMGLSMAQVLNKMKVGQKKCCFVWQSEFVGLQTHTRAQTLQAHRPTWLLWSLTKPHQHSHSTWSAPTHTHKHRKICVQTSVYHLSIFSLCVQTYLQGFWVFLWTTSALENQPQKRGRLLAVSVGIHPVTLVDSAPLELTGVRDPIWDTVVTHHNHHIASCYRAAAPSEVSLVRAQAVPPRKSMRGTSWEVFKARGISFRMGGVYLIFRCRTQLNI